MRNLTANLGAMGIWPSRPTQRALRVLVPSLRHAGHYAFVKRVIDVEAFGATRIWRKAMTTAYDFQLTTIEGAPLPLASFSGKPVLLVNTASKCGYTPQYAELQKLWDEFKSRDLTVLGVPCNDFGGQEPETESAIIAFCQRAFGITFPLTAKVHVRGAARHPLYTWLAAQGGFLSRPRWNFHKYLIGRDGKVADWFSSMTRPTAGRFRAAIQSIL